MTATDRALELVHAAAQAASDKLAENIIAFDVSEQLVITDAFVLCSASNDRQVKSIVDAVEDTLREIGAKPVRREGERDGRGLWGQADQPFTPEPRSDEVKCLWNAMNSATAGMDRTTAPARIAP